MAYPDALDRGDPVDFARHLFSDVAERLGDALVSHAPAALAAYRSRLAAACRAYPDGVGFGQPLTDLDEAALAWADESFWDGVRFGIAAAGFYRAIEAMSDVLVCPACHGAGVGRDAGRRRTADPCGRCAGAGTVEKGAAP